MYHRHLFPLSICLSLGLYSGTGQANPALMASEQDFLDDLPIVLSVSRLAQHQSEVPGSVTIIDSDTIRHSGAREIVDLFRLVPGFQVGYSGATPKVYYHGALDSFGQHLLVLIDGRSVYSPFLLGGVNWNNLPVALEDIERIEVLRGSNSAAYGSDAFLGVANIITKHPSQTRGWTVTQRGGQGVRDSLARYGNKNGEVDWRLTLGKRTNQGFSNDLANRDLRHFNLRADWRLNMQDELHLQIGGNNTGTNAGYPNDNGSHPGDAPRPQYRASSYLTAKWQRSISPEEVLHLAYQHTEERHTDNFPYGDTRYPGVVVDYGGNSSRDVLELQHTFSPWTHTRVVWGGELRRDTVQSLPLFATNDRLTTDVSRLFGNVEWRLTPQAVLNLGTSLEKNSLTGTSNSPRLMLNYHVNSENTFRIGATKAHRTPSLFEQKANVGYFLAGGLARQTFLATGTFQNEEILSREVGWLGNFRRIGLTADVRIFHESTKGLSRQNPYSAPFVLSPAVTNWINANFPQYGVWAVPIVSNAAKLGQFNVPEDFVNAGAPSIRGIEWDIEFKPFPSTRLSLHQAFFRIESIYPLPGAINPGDRQAAPTHSTSISWFQQLPQETHLSLMLYSVGAMHWSGQPESKIIPGYTRLDARLARRLHIGSQQAEIGITGQNLGSRYLETDTYFPFDRRIMVDMTLHF